MNSHNGFWFHSAAMISTARPKIEQHPRRSQSRGHHVDQAGDEALPKVPLSFRLDSAFQAAVVVGAWSCTKTLGPPGFSLICDDCHGKIRRARVDHGSRNLARGRFAPGRGY